MKESSHHYDLENLNPYHLEGDVFTHTMMVVNQVPDSASQEVLIAALLHDIGKPMARETKEETKRVRFFNHEPLSAYLSLQILRDMDLTDTQRVKIFQLIALHTEPFKLEPNTLADRMIHNRGLAMSLRVLNKADHDGRFHTQEKRGAEKLATFVPKCNTGMAKKMPTTNEVIVLTGLPCSGKSTYRNELEGYEVLSWDDTMLEMTEGETYGDKFKVANDKDIRKVMREKKLQWIKERKNVIIDMTNMSRKSRRKALAEFPSCYKRKSVVFLVDLETLDKRNEIRKAEGKYIPEDVFERMVKQFYPPLYDEFEEIEWILS